jgi:hypothetical protein
MRARLASLALAGVLIGGLHGCGGGSSGKDGSGDARDARADSGGEPDGPPGDKPSGGDANPDVAPDGPAGNDTGGGDTRADAAPPDVAADTGNPIDSGDAGCSTQTMVLARGGTTSACSFKVSASIPRDRVNLSIGGRLCQQGSNNCTSRGGWFWFGDEVALCDDTCIAWENSGANLILEVGCPSESCFVACHQAGGSCGDGINSCCAGWRCSGGTCAMCAWGGQACATTAECCSGTCKNGSCVDGIGGTCVSQAGCSAGECRDGRCQCTVDQILCNSGCVSTLDPNNCRGCGNVCPTGTGRVCTANGCVCDPASAFPDECNGTCVNKSNDRTNCGLCFNTCPKLEQVCNKGVCGCPGGMTDCNGSCTDTSSSQTHCGMCNRGCPVGTEVCSAGTCTCAAGYTRCPTGNCVNLKTDKYNCNACGTACPGNKTCNNGSCG